MRPYRCLQICLWTALLALASPVAATQAADATTPAQIKGIGNDFDALLQRAESGDAEAQYALAVRYEQGEGGGNPYEAQHWYEAAARQGQADAKAWAATHLALQIQQIADNMVPIDADFLIARFDVTQEQWHAVMGDNPAHFTNCGNRCPVESVSWDDVQTFIQTLNQLSGQQYRLPTQAEWEHACGKQTPYCGGSDLNQVAWYNANSSNQTQPVGQKKPNAYGLYDMSGDVWQWMSDCYRHDCNRHVVRGGSWNQPEPFLRAAFTTEGAVGNRNYSLGFRLAMNRADAVQEKPAASLPENDTLRTLEEEMIPIVGEFKISRYPITQAQWQTVMGYNPSGFSRCPDCPVEQVNWNEVQFFLEKLNQLTGRQYRLPSMQEWESASGLTQNPAHNGNMDAISAHEDSREVHTRPVGQKRANLYGLYDMTGNVRQWTSDCFNHLCEGRITLGSSWADNTTSLRQSPFSYRFLRVYIRSNTVGFRIVEALQAPK